MDMKKYYGQLVGAKIVGFHFEEDEFGGDDFPVYTLDYPELNARVKMTLSMDAEGNGGGFAFLEEIK